MSIIKLKQWALPLLAVLFIIVVAVGVKYHVDSVNSLKSEVAEVNETLKKTENNHSAQIKSKTEELNKLEKSHRQATEELEELNSQLEEKDDTIKNRDQEVENKIKEIIEKQKQIDKLKADLQAKAVKKQQEALVQKTSNKSSDKSQVLSNKKEAKPEQSAQKSTKSASKSEQSQPKAKNNSGGTTIGTFAVTFYSVGDGMTPSVTTANGTNVANTIYSPEGYRIIAVDPRVIPMNTIVQVTIGGETFMAKASDSGSAIKGNKIDLLVSTPTEARNRGRATATLKIVK